MNPGPRPQPFEPDAVEWRPSSPEAIEVRVAGSWQGATVPPPAVLVVEGFGRFEAMPGSVVVDRPPAWSAAFLVPIEARAMMESGTDALLELDDLAVPLPAAAPGRLGPEPPGATVVDPQVFAERRARREEAAEESAVERASTAEDTAATLRVQLGHLEERLASALGERDALAARVADAERQLRLSEQREEAERRGRVELEEDASLERRTAQRTLDELRDELAAVEETAERLELELGEARRRRDIAERAAAAERIAREKVDAQLEAALARVAQLEGAAGSEAEALRREAIALEQRLDEARAERARLEAGDAELDAARAEADELRLRLADVEARLTEEVAARAGAERRAMQTSSTSAREEALATEVASLTEELGRRTATQQRVQAAIQAVREELAAVRAQVDATRSGSTNLRAELTAAEHRRTTLEDALKARETELAHAREALEEARKAIAETRDDSVRARDRLDIAERAAAELRDRLAAERRLREAAQQSARAEVEPLVAELTLEVERLRASAAEFEVQLAEETMRREEAERDRDDARAAIAQARVARDAGAAAPPPAQPAPQEPAPREPAPRVEDSPRVASRPMPEMPTPTGDAALDALIAGLRAQVASARAQLEAWDVERAAGAEERARRDAAATEEPAPEGLAPREARPDARAGDAEPAPPAIAQPDDETRRRLQAIEADLRAATAPGADKPAREVIASLQDAAERLRAAAEDEMARMDEEPDEDAPGPAAPAGEVAARAQDAQAQPDDGEPARSILGTRPVVAGRERPWLRTAVERLAEADTAAGADLLVALLPAQALLGERLTYALTGEDLGSVRVALEPGTVRVDRNPGELDAEATVTGSIAALAPLAAGGGGWRLKDVRVEGAKRGVRRLARARRRPVGLGDLAALTPPPPPKALLTALAAAVDPGWTKGHHFGVSYLVTDPDVVGPEEGAEGAGRVVGRWTITADDGRPLLLTDNGGRQPHAATIELSPGALLPVLLGGGAPAGERAVVAGDRRAVDVLHAWFDRARGVAGG